MPSVRCWSERCKQVDKDIKSIKDIFFYGVLVFLCGLLMYYGLLDRCCREYIPLSVVPLFLGSIAILYGVMKLATCSFRRCEACENRGSTASARTDSSPRLMSEQSPPSYDMVVATPITTSLPTPPPKYEDVVNPLFTISGSLPPYTFDGVQAALKLAETDRQSASRPDTTTAPTESSKQAQVQVKPEAAGDESAAAAAADNFGTRVLRIGRKWLRRSRSSQEADGGQRNSALDADADVAARLATLDKRSWKWNCDCGIVPSRRRRHSD